MVVDGAARAETFKIAHAILRDRCSWNVISEPDGGVYDGQNKGLERCRGDYVQFLNSGDEYASVDGGLAQVVSVLESVRPFWLVVGAHYEEGVNSGQRIGNIPHIWWRHALGLQVHCHQACYFSVKYLRSIGGHKLGIGLAADYDVIMKCGIVERPYELNQQLIQYEGGGASARNWQRIVRETMEIRLDRLNAQGAAARIIQTGLAPRTALRGLKSRMRRALFWLARTRTRRTGRTPGGAN